MPLEPCPNCNRPISVAAESCPKCGEPLSDEKWAEKAVKDEENTTNIAIGCLSVFGLLVFIGALSQFFSGSECDDEVAAFVYSQQFIEKRLKNPQSAEFPYITNDNVRVISIGKCTYQIISPVSGDNSFGGTVQNYYTTVMKYDETKGVWLNYGYTTLLSSSASRVISHAQSVRNDF